VEARFIVDARLRAGVICERNMNRDEKAAVVDEIAGQLQEAEAIFAIDYRGISVSQAAELRGKLRDADAVFRIVKNSLTERAADKAGASELKELLDGPTALTFVSGDPVVAAKALNDTARAFQLLDFKGGLMNGNTLSAEEIRSLARLPAREVLHGQLVGTIASPLSGLVRTLNALIAGLAIQLQQVAEQGLVSGEAPAPEAEAAAEPEAEAAPEPEAEAAPEPEAEPEAEAAPEPEAEAAPEPEAEAAPEPEPEPEAEAQPEPEQAEQETESETTQEEE
jgi:large subunit ribosomal protein L10